MADPHDSGFAPPANIAPGGKRGTVAIVALVMIAALTIGTLTAAAVVALGVARGDGAAHGRAYAIELPRQLEHRG